MTSDILGEIKTTACPASYGHIVNAKRTGTRSQSEFVCIASCLDHLGQKNLMAHQQLSTLLYTNARISDHTRELLKDQGMVACFSLLNFVTIQSLVFKSHQSV